MLKAKYAVVFGRMDFSAEEGLITVFAASTAQVRKMASEFIQVIPDDLEGYEEDIKEWDGKAPLLITHQDDDTFYFSATKINGVTEDMSAFSAFVSEFVHAG